MIKCNLKKNGGWVYNSFYADLINIYYETGLFTFIAEAFVFCRKNGYEIPEDLAVILQGHLQRFVDADNNKAALAAFCFDSNSKGGAWQNKNAQAKWKQHGILNLLADMEAMGGCNKKKNFKAVAQVYGTTIARVKTLYYQRHKKSKPNP